MKSADIVAMWQANGVVDGERRSDLAEMHSVTFEYEPGRQVLKDVSVKLPGEGVLAVIGPNGGGKTTLVHILLGRLSPQQGETKPANGFSRVGYSSAGGADINPYLRCEDVAAIVTGLLGAFQAKDVLDAVGLTEWKRRRVRELSSGQRKKLSLVRAILLAQDLLVLDEPESHLDVSARAELVQIIKALQTRLAVLLISHGAS